MLVRVHNWAGWRCPWPARVLQQLLRAMLHAADVRMSLEVHVLRDGAMASANARHMACHGPTNVLSFPPSDPPQATAKPEHRQEPPLREAMPGIVLLSVDTLDRECFLYGQDRHEHGLRLLAHALAHVLGHDHGPRMDEVSLDLAAAGQGYLLSRQEWHEAD